MSKKLSVIQEILRLRPLVLHIFHFPKDYGTLTHTSREGLKRQIDFLRDPRFRVFRAKFAYAWWFALDMSVEQSARRQVQNGIIFLILLQVPGVTYTICAQGYDVLYMRTPAYGVRLLPPHNKDFNQLTSPTRRPDQTAGDIVPARSMMNSYELESRRYEGGEDLDTFDDKCEHWYAMEDLALVRPFFEDSPSLPLDILYSTSSYNLFANPYKEMCDPQKVDIFCAADKMAQGIRGGVSKFSSLFPEQPKKTGDLNGKDDTYLFEGEEMLRTKFPDRFKAYETLKRITMPVDVFLNPYEKEVKDGIRYLLLRLRTGEALEKMAKEDLRRESPLFMSPTAQMTVEDLLVERQNFLAECMWLSHKERFTSPEYDVYDVHTNLLFPDGCTALTVIRDGYAHNQKAFPPSSEQGLKIFRSIIKHPEPFLESYLTPFWEDTLRDFIKLGVPIEDFSDLTKRKEIGERKKISLHTCPPDSPIETDRIEETNVHNEVHATEGDPIGEAPDEDIDATYKHVFFTPSSKHVDGSTDAHIPSFARADIESAFGAEVTRLIKEACDVQETDVDELSLSGGLDPNVRQEIEAAKKKSAAIAKKNVENIAKGKELEGYEKAEPLPSLAPLRLELSQITQTDVTDMDKWKSRGDYEVDLEDNTELHSIPPDPKLMLFTGEEDFMTQIDVRVVRSQERILLDHDRRTQEECDRSAMTVNESREFFQHLARELKPRAVASLVPQEPLLLHNLERLEAVESTPGWTPIPWIGGIREPHLRELNEMDEWNYPPELDLEGAEVFNEKNENWSYPVPFNEATQLPPARTAEYPLWEDDQADVYLLETSLAQPPFQFTQTEPYSSRSYLAMPYWFVEWTRVHWIGMVISLLGTRWMFFFNRGQWEEDQGLTLPIRHLPPNRNPHRIRRAVGMGTEGMLAMEQMRHWLVLYPVRKVFMIRYRFVCMYYRLQAWWYYPWGTLFTRNYERVIINMADEVRDSWGFPSRPIADVLGGMYQLLIMGPRNLAYFATHAHHMRETDPSMFLLVGSSFAGKTFLAKSVAGDCGVNIFSFTPSSVFVNSKDIPNFGYVDPYEDEDDKDLVEAMMREDERRERMEEDQKIPEDPNQVKDIALYEPEDVSISVINMQSVDWFVRFLECGRRYWRPSILLMERVEDLYKYREMGRWGRRIFRGYVDFLHLENERVQMDVFVHTTQCLDSIPAMDRLENLFGATVFLTLPSLEGRIDMLHAYLDGFTRTAPNKEWTQEKLDAARLAPRVPAGYFAAALSNARMILTYKNPDDEIYALRTWAHGLAVRMRTGKTPPLPPHRGTTAIRELNKCIQRYYHTWSERGLLPYSYEVGNGLDALEERVWAQSIRPWPTYDQRNISSPIVDMSDAEREWKRKRILYFDGDTADIMVPDKPWEPSPHFHPFIPQSALSYASLLSKRKLVGRPTFGPSPTSPRPVWWQAFYRPNMQPSVWHALTHLPHNVATEYRNIRDWQWGTKSIGFAKRRRRQIRRNRRLLYAKEQEEKDMS